MYYNIKIINAQAKTTCFIQEDKVKAIILENTGHFIMFSMITNLYNKKTKGPTLMELFKATGNLKKFFLTTRDV